MYSFRKNLDSGNVEVVKDGYVEYEIPKAEFSQFAHQAWNEAKNPTKMRKVRNQVDYTIK